MAARIEQADFVGVVAQVDAAVDISGVYTAVRRRVTITRQDDVRACVDPDGAFDDVIVAPAVGQPPPGQVHAGGAGVVDLDPLAVAVVDGG